MGETVAGVDPDETRGDILDHWHGLAIDPAALQCRYVPGDAKYAMAMGAIAFGAGAVLRQYASDVGRGALAQEDLFKQSRQRFEGQVLRDSRRHLIVWRRHLKLQTNYWRGQQRTRVMQTD
ncbi:hypothetical protein D3C84_902940 [compost metagenome]